MRIASPGHALLAATLIALGLLGLVSGDFTAVWEPVPKHLPARPALAYLCALISLAAGMGLLWPRTAAVAARTLLGYLLLWLALFRLPVALRAPTAAVSWESCGETAVIVAAAWVLYAWFAAAWDRRRLRFATGASGVHIARVLYGLALLAFGVSHLAYVKQSAALVPNWLPAHEGWVYLTGCTYLAAAVAVLVGVCARLAAALAALQIGLFTLLVWVPIVAATGPKDAFQWSETLISWALTASAWVLADSYRLNSRLTAAKH